MEKIVYLVGVGLVIFKLNMSERRCGAVKSYCAMCRLEVIQYLKKHTGKAVDGPCRATIFGGKAGQRVKAAMNECVPVEEKE